MTHDPLCPCAPIDPIRPGGVHTANSASCLCVLIARVRADERRKHSDKTKHLRDRIERLIDKANRWRDENVELRKQLKELK
jgi:hypothetical protein